MELFKIGQTMRGKERQALMERALDYAMKYNKTLTWKRISNIEKKLTAKKGREIMLKWKSFTEEERERGEKKGEKRGEKKGEKRGEKRGKRKIAKKMLKYGLAISTVQNCTGLPKGELQKLKNNLNKVA